MMQKFKKYSSNSACIDTDYKDATGTDQRNSLYFTINKGDDPHIVLAIEEEDQENSAHEGDVYTQ